MTMKAQARWELMDRTDVFYIGVVFLVFGTVLVVSSFLALGFTGTFLGKYQTNSVKFERGSTLILYVTVNLIRYTVTSSV